MVIPATEYAWAAGVIDGEGHLGLSLTGGFMRAVVRVQMCDEAAIDRLHGMFPGSLKYGPLMPPSHRAAGKRPQFAFILSRRSAMRSALQLIAPYVTTKVGQVAGLLRWLERPQREIPQEERALMAEAVNSHNHRKSKW